MDQHRQIERPKVSVIIPVYNTEDYLEEAVRSIMNQTLKEIEIIIIDDGSIDNSLSIIEELSNEDSRISCYTQENSGLSQTRNRGIELAFGEFIYFMDSDDILALNALELCYSQAKRKELDFVFFDGITFSDERIVASDTTYKRTYIFDEEIVYNGIDMLNRMLENYIYRASACMIFINYDFLVKHNLNFYPGIIHEDELFTSQLYLFACRVSCVKKDFYSRRIRTGSIMSTMYSIRNIEDYLTVINELKLLAHKEKRFKPTIEKTISYILNPAIYNSKDLSTVQRLKVFVYCIRHRLIHYLKVKHIFVMLFPFFITLKKVLKK